MKSLSLLLAFVLVPSVVIFSNEGAEKATRDPALDLEEVQNLNLELLRSVTCVVMPEDGKFLYAAAYNSDVVAAFSRDTATGQLELEQDISSKELDAAVSIRLSRDGQYAVASAFSANAINLFRRDAATGYLNLLDVARDGVGDNEGLNFVVDANFSKDNRFIYTAASEGVGVFRVQNDKLAFVQCESAGGRLLGARAATVSPDGAWIYVPAPRTGTLGVLHGDPATGKVEVIQLLIDGENGVNALEGVFRAACSPDGRNVYVSAGRFGGDQAISAFKTQGDGKLELLEEHVNGVAGFSGFEGGNDIKVSPDGRLVYALGTLSDRLVRFAREPATGKLTFLGSQSVGVKVLPGSANLAFSPDGKFVYVADENANSIVVFKQPIKDAAP
jgi:6-phosphogluconolactonase (cycloisomerase 2 family)